MDEAVVCSEIEGICRDFSGDETDFVGEAGRFIGDPSGFLGRAIPACVRRSLLSMAMLCLESALS